MFKKIDSKILFSNKEKAKYYLIPCSKCLKMQDNCRCIFFYKINIENYCRFKLIENEIPITE